MTNGWIDAHPLVENQSIQWRQIPLVILDGEELSRVLRAGLKVEQSDGRNDCRAVKRRGWGRGRRGGSLEGRAGIHMGGGSQEFEIHTEINLNDWIL